MAKKPLPDPELLRKLLDYDPETGLFTWKPRPESMFPNKPKAKRWNTRYANKRAGNSRPYQKGYFALCLLGTNYQCHRVAWAWMFGAWPTDQIDHINGNPADNRIKNLRSVDQTENSRNQKRPRNNSSGVVGVSYRKNTGYWYAYISLNGKRVSLGSHPTFNEAVAVRKEAEARHGFHPNHGRSG